LSKRKSRLKEKKIYFGPKENEPILGHGEKEDEKNLSMDKSSHKAPNLKFTSLDPYIEETTEIHSQAQVGDVMET